MNGLRQHTRSFAGKTLHRFINRDPLDDVGRDRLAMQAITIRSAKLSFRLSTRSSLCSALHLIGLPRPWLRGSSAGL